MKVHVCRSQKYKMSENCLCSYGGTHVSLACYVTRIILPLLSPSNNILFLNTFEQVQFGCWE